MKFAVCPDCHMPIVLRKGGIIPRHGWKGYARNKRINGFRMENNYEMVETKPACTGSYKRIGVKNGTS